MAIFHHFQTTVFSIIKIFLYFFLPFYRGLLDLRYEYFIFVLTKTCGYATFVFVKRMVVIPQRNNHEDSQREGINNPCGYDMNI